MSLTDQARSGLLWSLVERFGTQGIQFVVGIILARILSPEAYGIIAMPMVFIALAQVFIDSGFFTALVRKPDLKEVDLSTAFIFNIFVGIICYCILFSISPFIAYFYQTPILSSILKVTALATLFNPLCTVQQAILTRKIDFKTQSAVSLISAVLSGITGIWMAYNGFGVWALVFQQTVSALLRVILLWYLAKWKPITGWSNDSFKYLWNFGSKIIVTSSLDALYNNVFPIVIGKFYTPSLLGNYTRAQQFADLPASNITGVLQRIVFPVLSKIQQDEDKVKKQFLRIVDLSSFIVLPLMVGLAAVSQPLISFLLGDQWGDCASLLALLCIAKMLSPVHILNLSILHVKGRTDLSLKVELLKKVLAMVILAITIPLGVKEMCIGMIFQSFIGLFFNTYYTGVILNVTFAQQIRIMIPNFVMTFVMFIVVSFFVSIISYCLAQLIIGIGIGACSYIVMAYLFRKEMFLDMLSIIRNKKE